MKLAIQKQQEDYVLPLRWAPLLIHDEFGDLTPEEYDAATHWRWSQFRRVGIPCELVDPDGWHSASHDASHLAGPCTVSLYLFLV